MESAQAAARTKGPYLAAQFRRIAARRGPNKAAVAVARSMVISAWHMLTTGEVDRDLGSDYFTRREDPERRARRLSRQIEELGLNVTLTPAA